MSAVIELHEVTKVYRRDSLEIPVLERVSFEVPAGDFLGLMGPSGSGKSTLLNLVAGIDRPTRGSIRVAATDITTLSERGLSKWRARHIGFIFQLYNLIPVLTAFENVELPLLLTRLSRSERRDHVMTALDIVGVERSGGPLSAATLGRPGAARGDRAGHRDGPDGAARRRAHRRSGREVGHGCPDPAAAAQRGVRQDDRHGDA